jgi:hypothetical protein
MHLFQRLSVVVQGALSLSGLWPDASHLGSLSDSVQDLHGSGGLTGNISPEHVPYGINEAPTQGPAIWKTVDEMPTDVEYDFIIVGGKLFENFERLGFYLFTCFVT